jgi:hypothetical protein
MLVSVFVESRTRWRKSEPGVREGVAAVLEALREGIGAEALGLFDDDRAEDAAFAGAGGLNFWQAFHDLSCGGLAGGEGAWSSWYAGLRRDERAETVCGCGQEHKVLGFLIHERWALLVVAPPQLDSGAVAALSSSLKALHEKLPPGKTPELDRDDVPYLDRERAGSGAPVWWVRNSRQ